MSYEEDFLMAKVKDLESRLVEVEEKLWPGRSSSASTTKQETSDEQSSSSPQSPAQTTENP